MKFDIFENLKSNESINEYVKEVISECEASYPMMRSRKFPVAVDIGANVGGFCVHAHKYFDKIYAFEPLVENYVILEKVLSLFGVENVEAYNNAIHSESHKKLKLRVSSNRKSGSVTCAEIDNADLEKTYSDLGQECETISLNDIFDTLEIDRIDYLKIDCEGSEYEILENFNNYEKVTMIALELHGTQNVSRKKKLLQSLEKYYNFVPMDKVAVYDIRKLDENKIDDIDLLTDKVTVFGVSKNINLETNNAS